MLEFGGVANGFGFLGEFMDGFRIGEGDQETTMTSKLMIINEKI